MRINDMSIALLLALSMGGPAVAAGSGGHDHGVHPNDGMTADRTVEVVARDVEFSTSEISISPGETIRFVIRNEGMGDHDFTIGDQATQNAHREVMMEMMMAGNMHAHDHGASNAVLVPPGETRELTWTFTGDEDLLFGCNVPGHFESGMHGNFVVGSEE